MTKSGHVVSQAIRSQVSIHEEWGGVVPTLAKEAHQIAIDDVVKECLSKAKVTDIGRQVAAMAVTVGPGLSMCLRVGVRKAQKISGEHGIPIVPVHHMEAHCLVARVKEEEWNSESVEIANKNEVAKFPFVALLVSGGHNVLLKVEGVGKYTILGQTLDDAIGEAYDKPHDFSVCLSAMVAAGVGKVGQRVRRDGFGTATGASEERNGTRGSHNGRSVRENHPKKSKESDQIHRPTAKTQNVRFQFRRLKTNVRLAIKSTSEQSSMSRNQNKNHYPPKTGTVSKTVKLVLPSHMHSKRPLSLILKIASKEHFRMGQIRRRQANLPRRRQWRRGQSKSQK